MSWGDGRASARVAGVVAVALALGLVACGLLRGPQAPRVSVPALRFRFALLAPFEQVASAASAELRAMGGTERESVGDESVSFRVMDEKHVGEDTVTLRGEGTILVFEFRLHRKPDDDRSGNVIARPTNPGADVNGKVKNPAGDVKNPGEAEREPLVGFSSSEDDSREAHSTALRIVKLLVCLPGVGDLVDQDGVPKERQLFRGDGGIDEVCRVRTDAGAAAPIDVDASPGDAPPPSLDGGTRGTADASR